jgi:ABC-type branched-subunit amino acid transport system permease subunit
VQTLFGPVVGTGAIMYLENVLSAKTSAWRLIEGLIFVAVIVLMPAGIVGTIARQRGRSAGAILRRALRLGTPRSESDR